ncbi:hypothetical protein KGM48_01745 [Patescibacteria group bacterium]|nr:hypothetical protein [Patescibacteria group bacterium]
MRRRSFVQTAAFALMMAAPSLASAAGLTSSQVGAILGLLRAFSAPETVIASVAGALGGSSISDPLPNSAATSSIPAPLTRPDTTGSPYRSGSLGYDLSFNTRSYPDASGGFMVVGVTAGKAYVYNNRLHSEYALAQFGATLPTLYLNLNAPYGSTATSEHMSAPRTCDVLFGATTTSRASGGTYPEPSACASYNYGYNAAKSAYRHANSVGVSSFFWWLDIEEENSWSIDTAVNDAVIQGAIDFLNTEGVRAGIYSMPYMWRRIAGTAFVPAQTIAKENITTPTWFPIGVASQVKATNACLTGSMLIPGSPVWIIQYEASPTAVDQNIAC